MTGQTERQVVVITGAGGQVGGAVARRLQGRAPLALFERATSLELGLEPGVKTGVFGGVDLTDEAALQAAVARVRKELGPIRALVHTVGGYAGGAEVAAQSLDTVRGMIDLNYVAAVQIVRAVLPDILAAEHGRIVLFGSAAAVQGRAGASAYAASKAALLRFAEALAEEVAPQRVGVRVILPTTIDTPRNRADMPKGRFADWVTPDEIASTVEFLIDPASSGIRFAAVPMGR